MKKSLFFLTILILSIIGFTEIIPYNNTEAVMSKNADASKVITGMTNMVVVVDSGHGGKRPGCIYHDINEKDINLAIALKLKDCLVLEGATVYMTRETDKDLDSKQVIDNRMRAQLANDKNANIFVSIHCNSSVAPTANGVTVIFTNSHDISASQKLGNSIHSQIISSTCLTQNQKPYSDDFTVFKNTIMPAVIIETGFLSNESDRKYITSSNGQKEIANSICIGIKKWWYDYILSNNK